MKRLLVGVGAALTVLVGVAAPAVGEQPPPRDIGTYANDEQACAQQQQLPVHRSPSCQPGGTGITENHNETLVGVHA